LVEFDLFRIGIAESITATLALKLRKVGAFLEEIFVRLLQILQGVLQRMTRRVLQPRCVGTIAPPGQLLRHGDVADELAACLVIFFLQRQCLVVDEPARASETAHIALLLTIWHQFVLESLEAVHAVIIYSILAMTSTI
jgi:hypothetical protein